MGALAKNQLRCINDLQHKLFTTNVTEKKYNWISSKYRFFGFIISFELMVVCGGNKIIQMLAIYTTGIRTPKIYA